MIKTTKASREKNQEIAANSEIAAQTELKIWQGVKLEQQGKLDEAIDCYRQAVEINPQSSEARQILELASKKQIQQQSIEMANHPNVSFSENLASLTDKNNYQITQIKNNLEPYVNHASTKQQFENNINAESNLNLSLLANYDRSEIQSSSSVAANEELVDIVPETSPSRAIAKLGEGIAFPTIDSINLEARTTNSQLEVAKIYLQQAIAYAEEKRWQQSFQTCQLALKINPNSAEVYKTWGDILQKMGKKAEAIGCYAQAIALEPQMPAAYANLGSLYASQEKWTKAIEYYEKALALDPNSAGINRSLAKIWEELEEDDKALGYFLQALELEPRTLTPQQYFHFANELLEEAKLEEAIALYRQGIKLAPDFKDCHLQLARALEQNGQIEEASWQYRQIIAIQSQKKPKKAKKRLQNLLANSEAMKRKNKANHRHRRLTPHQSSSNQQLLLAPGRQDITPPVQKSLKGDRSLPQSVAKIDSAIKLYLQKAQTQPDSATIRLNLGSLFAAKQEWQKSISCYQKAIELDPNSAMAYRNLAKAYRQIGKDDVAAVVLYRGNNLEPERVSGKEHFRLGEILLRQKKLEQAIACYRWAIKFDPNLSQPYVRIGEILDAQNNRSTAIACYQKAIQKNPENGEAYFAWGKNLAQQENWQKAVICYQKAIKLKFNNWDIYHKLGDALSKLEQWQAAIVPYQKAIELKPNFSWSYNNLGDALLHLKRWWEAANCFQTAIKLNPDFPWSYYNLGESLVELEKWDEAYEAYNQARSLDPQLPQINKKLGTVARKRGNHNSAATLDLYLNAIKEQPEDEENYLNAIDLKSDDPELYLQFGNSLTRQNRGEEAIFAYHMAIKNDPQNEELYVKLGKILIEQERWQQAVDCYRRGLEANPKSETLNFLLGEALIKQEKLDEAIVVLKRALAIQPHLIAAYQHLVEIFTYLNQTEELSWAYLNLGEILAAENRLEEAVQVLQKSLTINPQGFAAYNCLGNVYCWQEQFDKAIAAYRQAIAIKADFAWAYKGLGDALSKHNQVAEATEAYRQAMQLDPYIFDSALP